MADNQVPSQVYTNPKTTTVNQELLNKQLLSNFSAQFDVIQSAYDNIAPIPSDDFLSSMNLKGRVETYSGDPHTIDVQSDMRFPFHYIAYTIYKRFPALDVNPSAFVSPPLIIAYCLNQVIHHITLIDLKVRHVPSGHAILYQDDASLAQFLDFTLDLPVIDDIKLIIESLAPVRDPMHPNMHFIPSFAGSVFAHDFGRMVPVAIFIVLHNVIATYRTSVSVDELERLFHNTVIMTIHNRNYSVSHFIGGTFTSANNNALIHPNFLNRMFKTMIHRMYGRLLTQNPTMQPIPFTPLESQTTRPNPYILMAHLTPQTLQHLKSVYKSVSGYLKAQGLATLPLRSVSQNYSGSTLFSHYQVPITLPTWHYHTIHPEPIDEPSAIVNSIDYARYSYFLIDEPSYRSTLPCPTPLEDPLEATSAPETAKAKKTQSQDKSGPSTAQEPVEPPATAPPRNFAFNMYNVTPTNHAEYRAYGFLRFNETLITPPAIIVQPYEPSFCKGTRALILGTQIEQSSIDGIQVPTPDPNSSLASNNSRYLTGSIPINSLKPVIPQHESSKAMYSVRRNVHLPHNDAIGIHFVNSSQIARKIYANANCQPNLPSRYGTIREEHHGNRLFPYTYTAWNSADGPSFQDRTMLLWSSYRHVNRDQAEGLDISMYSSLVGLYGTSCPKFKTRHPINIVPQI
jgi:hypothetical protein